MRCFVAEAAEIAVVTGPVFAGETLARIGCRVLVPTALYKAVYAPEREAAAAYLAPNAPGLAWQAVSLAELPATARDWPLALPEPQLNNIGGACKGQTAVASATPGGAARPANPAASFPAPAPTLPRRGGSTPPLLGAGPFAVVMILLLLRVLGRRRGGKGMTEKTQPGGPAGPVTISPFADKAAATAVGGLTVENRLDRVSLYGTLDLTGDRQGLAEARRLRALLEAVVATLEQEEDRLPERLGRGPGPERVPNPFG